MIPFNSTTFRFPDLVAPSAWVEHVPFMFWLIDALRPRRFVELGTHAGVSYCAACQAIELLGLHCSCYAIDTWKGDEHAGHYDEKVYRDLAAYHAPKYAAFSRLVRSTFDAAVDHFEDASIDLLHIDGLHTYDAVRHDFETWRPKLTQNAIVLFHDTNVRERDFAVFRLWDEISAGRPHFEFLHGHGLGVLGIGDSYPKAVEALFAAGEQDYDRGAVRTAFAHLGQVADRENTARAVRHAEAQFALSREEWQRQVEARDGEIATLRAECEQRAIQVGEREVQFAVDRQEWQRQIEGRDAKILRTNAQVIEKAEEIQVLKERLSVALTDRENARSEEKRLHNVLSAVYSSTSWRVTVPLRAAKRLLTTFGK
ncbi:class I SAM-dependent methyltransferase [Mesorhizobium sp. M0938]|uniref:class I SAM-dependent methyltransferase n=1 Tax=unclassified Mesorhizobium TaxID=325217 RepID=UPI00333926F5